MYSKVFKKAVSLIIIVAFLSTNTLYAAPSPRSLFKNKRVDYKKLSAQQEERLDKKKSIFIEGNEHKEKRKKEAKRVLQRHLQDLTQIHIPSEIGRVTEVYQAPEKDSRLVVHIQDLHTNPEAQYNLANILEILLKDYDMGLVCSEGADGEVDTSSVSSFPDYEVREKTAKIFVNSGELTGEEYLSITKYPDLPIWGIEDRDIYFKNIIQFNKIMKFNADSQVFISRTKEALDNLKPTVYSRELKEIDKKEQDYENEEIETDEYLKYLTGYLEDFNIPTSDYENISLLNEAVEQEKTIDQQKIMQESQNILLNLQAAISKKSLRSEMDSLMVKAQLFKEQKISPFSFYSYLKDLALRHNVIASPSFSVIASPDEVGTKQSQYPHLLDFVDYLTKVNSLDTTKLFIEMEALTYDVKQRLAKTGKEKTLTKAVRNIKFLEGFFNLKISNEELGYYLQNKDTHNVAFFKTALTDLTGKTGSTGYIDFNPGLIDFRLPELEEFYETVIERDVAMVQNATSEIEKRNAKVAALISGGFHTKGIIRMLRDKGYSYIVVSPYSSTDIDEENYHFLLSGKRKPLSELIEKLNSTLRLILAFVKDKTFVDELEKILGEELLTAERMLTTLPLGGAVILARRKKGKFKLADLQTEFTDLYYTALGERNLAIELKEGGGTIQLKAGDEFFSINKKNGRIRTSSKSHYLMTSDRNKVRLAEGATLASNQSMDFGLIPAIKLDQIAKGLGIGKEDILATVSTKRGVSIKEFNATEGNYEANILSSLLAANNATPFLRYLLESGQLKDFFSATGVAYPDNLLIVAVKSDKIKTTGVFIDGYTTFLTLPVSMIPGKDDEFEAKSQRLFSEWLPMLANPDGLLRRVDRLASGETLYGQWDKWISRSVTIDDLNIDMFRDYDYRSIGPRLKPEVVFRLGLTLADIALEKAGIAGIENRKVLVARDARKVEPELLQALIASLRYMGLDVIYIAGAGPNAATTYSWAAQEHKPLMSIFLTASHVSEPKHVIVRGFKVAMLDRKDGNLQSMTVREIKQISKKAIIDLIENPHQVAEMEREKKGDFILSDVDENSVRMSSLVGEVAAQEGSLYDLAREMERSDSPVMVLTEWEDRFGHSNPLKGMKVVVEGSHTPSGRLAADTFEQLGAEVVLINGDIEEVEGKHTADPSDGNNLIEVKKVIVRENADFGVAFDLDGDRGAIIIPTRYKTQPGVNFRIVPPDNLIVALLPYYIEKLGYDPEVTGKKVGVIRDVLGTFGVNDRSEELGVESFQTDAGYVFLKAKRAALLEKGYVVPIYGERSGHTWQDVTGEFENPIAVTAVFAAMVKGKKYKVDDTTDSLNPFLEAFIESTVPYKQSPRSQPFFHPTLLSQLSSDSRNETGWRYDPEAKPKAPQAIIALGKDAAIRRLQEEFKKGKAYNTPAGRLKVKEFNTYQDSPDQGGLYRFADIVFEQDGLFAGRFVFRASSNDPTFVSSFETPLMENESYDSKSIDDRYISIGGLVLDWLEKNEIARVTGDIEYLNKDVTELVVLEYREKLASNAKVTLGKEVAALAGKNGLKKLQDLAKVNLAITDSKEDAEWRAARKITDLIKEKNGIGAKVFIGFATGGTYEGIYKKVIGLTKALGISWENVVAFNLDEYVWGPGYPEEYMDVYYKKESYRDFIYDNLFTWLVENAGLKEENIHLMDGLTNNPRFEAKYYDDLIMQTTNGRGVDLQLLGIGVEGHVAFIETRSDMSLDDFLAIKTKVEVLSPSTIKANSRFFDNNEDAVPARAITQGIATILSAQELLLVGIGNKKTVAITKTVSGPVSAGVPASILQLHEKATIIADKDAASDLISMAKSTRIASNAKFDISIYASEQEKMEHVFAFLGWEVLEDTDRFWKAYTGFSADNRIVILAENVKEEQALIKAGVTDDIVDILVLERHLKGYSLNEINARISMSKNMVNMNGAIKSPEFFDVDFFGHRLDYISKIDPQLAKDILGNV